MVIVGAPSSTQPSLILPTAAELLAEQADRAVTFTNTPPLSAWPLVRSGMAQPELTE